MANRYRLHATILDPSGKDDWVVGQGSMMFISDAGVKQAIVKVEQADNVRWILGEAKLKENVCRWVNN